MTHPGGKAPEPVEVTLLQFGDEIARGGQGTVTRVRNTRIADSWPAVFKEYDEGNQVELDAEALHRMVAFAHEQSAEDVRWLFEHTAWPAVVVQREGRAVGFLMREVPERFFVTLDTGDRKVAGTEYLLNSDAYLRAVGLSITPAQRMKLLHSTACILTRLHRMGVAVGDLSPKNLLYSLAPAPVTFPLDCDAMRVREETVLPQAETPDWELPEGEELGTCAGDAYKFALLAMRLTAGDQSILDPTTLSGYPALKRLASSSLTRTSPHTRPPISAWIGPLREAAETTSLRRSSHFVTPAGGKPSAHSSPPPTTPGPAIPTAQPQGKRGEGPGLLVGVAVLAYFIYSLISQTSGPDLGVGSSSGMDAAGESASSQAVAVQDLLKHNEGTRVAVSEAVEDVQRCDTSDAISMFDSAARQREGLLRSLEKARVDKLSGGKAAVRSLRSGWKHSAAADRAYKEWAESMSVECQAGGSHPDLRTAAEESDRATEAKKRFVSQWKHIAGRHELRTWSWDEL